MKKIISILALLILLTSCHAGNSIYYNLYFASIGFEYADGEYTGYFFLPSSMNIGNEKDNNEQKAEIAKAKGKKLQDVFNNIESSSFLIMNFQHISSLVLHESIIKADKLNEVIEFVNSFKEIDKNFFVFSTSDKIEDVYKLKNMNNESLILTTLTEPKINQYIFSSSSPIHYLNFCRDYYNNMVIDLPYIEVESIFNEEIDSIICKGVCFISKEKYLIFDSNNLFNYFNNNINMSYYDDAINIIIEKYKVKYNYKESNISMNIDLEYRILNSNIDNSEDYIKQCIEKIISDTFSTTIKKIDFLNIKFYDSNNELKIKIQAQEK